MDDAFALSLSLGARGAGLCVFVFERFPAQDNYRAWANFEFIADDGSINEVDLLVACPQGIFLVEIKSDPGTLRGDTLQASY